MEEPGFILKPLNFRLRITLPVKQMVSILSGVGRGGVKALWVSINTFLIVVFTYSKGRDSISVPPRLNMYLYFLQNLYVEILPPSVMLFGGGTFGRWFSQDSRALMDEITAHTKETSKSFFTLFTRWGHSEETAV